MEARRRIESASFGPEVLLAEAFDQAWESIKATFGDDALACERARLHLADCLLSVANEQTRDVEALKVAALEKMALSYKRRT
jgi:hypothetical protein